MPQLAILVGLLVLVVTLGFSAGRFAPTLGIPYDHQADVDSQQVELFARAAWWAARGTGGGVMTGFIPRSAIILPPSFQDNPSSPYQAWSDGTYLWIWTADPSPMTQRISVPFLGVDNTGGVAVGQSNASTVNFRYGGGWSPRPSVVSYPSLVIRINIP